MLAFLHVVLATLVRHVSAYRDETSVLQMVAHSSRREESYCSSADQKADHVESQADYSLAKQRCKAVMGRAPPGMRESMHKNLKFVCNLRVTNLCESNFTKGTFIIRKPGIYRLRSDIAMSPSDQFMMPPKDSEKYPLNEGYWLGFVAAIAVASDHVFLDLNGFKLRMSREFNSRQRFFSIIQLGERPFEAEVGPPQFAATTSKPFWASNVVISDGTLGRSSHAGVHGWSNNNIWIDNVRVRDFETAGIQLNGATHVHITNSVVGPSLGAHNNTLHAGAADEDRRVPGLATLSQAQLLLRIQENEDQITNMTAFAEIAGVAFKALRDSVEGYIQKIKKKQYDNFTASETIFENTAGLPDGSSLYGILLHAAKPAIHDFASCSEAQELHTFFGPVNLTNVTVKDLKIKTDEVVHMTVPVGENKMKPIMGPAGDLLQVFRFSKVAGGDREYVRNVLSDAQLAMGLLKANHSGNSDEKFRLFGATHIPSVFHQWTQGQVGWNAMRDSIKPKMVCLKDAMNHHNKGIMGMRIEHYHNVTLNNLIIKCAENTANFESENQKFCTETSGTDSGSDARGMTLAHVFIESAEDILIKNISTRSGNAFGLDEWEAVVHKNFNKTEWDIKDIIALNGSSAARHSQADSEASFLGMLSSDS